MTPEAYRAAAPALSSECEQAVAVWNFCGGWQPATLPLAVTWHQVADVELLIHLLLAIREKSG